MITARRERVGLKAARPVLVVGMAPARSGADSSVSADTHVWDRLAGYAGVEPSALSSRVDFANLLEAWPGDADGTKWDAPPERHVWELVGQRAALLYADCCERPRARVVGLGGWVRDALTHWWDLPRPGDGGWFEHVTVGNIVATWSPHPAGTSTWWNDAANREAGETFWRNVYAATRQYPRPVAKVPLSVRSAWTLRLIDRFIHGGWPAGCVDWPWVDPSGRPAMYYQGRNMPVSHVVLELTEGDRPSPEHQALHSCDRGEHCFNAAHLRWGTELENRLDQVNRRRGTIGKIGLETAQAMLAEYDALVARMAKDNDCSISAVRGIVERRSWREEKWG